MKLTVLTSSIQIGGALHDLFYNKTAGRYDLVGITDNGNTVITGEIVLSKAEIVSILNAGGKVEEYLMVVVADKAILNDAVSASLPNAINRFGNANTFENMFDYSAEVWIDAADIASATKVYFFSNPIGTTKQQYLTGTQLRTLVLDFGTSRNLDVLTVTQFEAIAGLTKI